MEARTNLVALNGDKLTAADLTASDSPISFAGGQGTFGGLCSVAYKAKENLRPTVRAYGCAASFDTGTARDCTVTAKFQPGTHQIREVQIWPL